MTKPWPSRDATLQCPYDDEGTCGASPWVVAALLAIILLSVLIVRLPLLYRQAGGQDEDFYAVPGAAVLENGVPRIPYVPSRDPQSVFYRADKALFALPPAYFYWQAAVYLVAGSGYAQGRLASLVAGLAAVVATYLLGKRLTGSSAAALVGCGLYAWSRAFFFPATMARPDMLCATFGLAAAVCLLYWQERASRSWLAASGFLVGLAMLTHPFALAIFLHLALFCLVARRRPASQLAADQALFAGSAAVALALWLPLIAVYPEEFRAQFFNNVLNRSGPGLLSRLFWPFDSLAAQWRLLTEHLGVLQTGLVGLGLLGAAATAVWDWRQCRRNAAVERSRLATAVWLAWTSVFLLVVCQGEHPAKGYWCYPAAFSFLCLGGWIVEIRRRLTLPNAAFAGLLIVAALAIAPGSGLRAWATYLRHFNDVDYDARAFMAARLRELPDDAVYLVDVTAVLDFYLAGREASLAQNDPQYFRAEQQPYDWLVVGRPGLDEKIPQQLGAVFVRSRGIREDELACYVEIYRRPSASVEP